MSRAWSIGKTDRFKMTAEIKKNMFMKNVGPASYGMNNSTRNKEPHWTFGGRIKKKEGTFSPSPGAYEIQNHKSCGRSDAQKYGFGTDKRKDMSMPNISPGPGAYKTRSIGFNYKNPNFYMGEKIE